MMEYIEALRLSPGDVIVISGGDAPDEEMLNELAAAVDNYIIWLGPGMTIGSLSREDLEIILQEFEDE